MRISFRGDQNAKTPANGHRPLPKSGWRLWYRRWRSRMRWPETWKWRNLGRKHRRIVIGAGAAVAVLLVIALWPPKGFTAHGVVTAQEVLLNADSDLVVTDCYVRVGDRVDAGEPLYVTLTGDPGEELATLEGRMETLQIRLLSLEALDAAREPALADDVERLAQAEAAVAAAEAELAGLPSEPDLAAIDRELASADAAVDAAMSDHRRSQVTLGEIERLRALDAAPIGDLRGAEDEESRRYQVLQTALLHKRQTEGHRARVIAEHSLARAAAEDALERERERVAAIRERLELRRDRLVADLRQEIDTIREARRRLRERYRPTTVVAPASCVVREIAVTDGTALVAGDQVMRIDLDDRLQVRAYVPGHRRSAIDGIANAAIFPDDDGRIAGRVTVGGHVALPVPAAVAARGDFDQRQGLLVLVEPEEDAHLVPGEVVRLRLW